MMAIGRNIAKLREIVNSLNKTWDEFRLPVWRRCRSRLAEPRAQIETNTMIADNGPDYLSSPR